MNTLRLPINFSVDNRIETITEGSVEYYSTLLANTLRIEPRELPINTSFGVLDPAFDYQKPIDAIRNACRYIPEILIIDVSSKLDDTGSIDTMVNFTIKET